MKKEIGGKAYVQVPELRMCSCDGCVTIIFSKLCQKLRAGGIHSCAGKIFKEQTMSEQNKTAVELVDELDRYLTGGPLGCHDPTATGLAKSIKAAIEREQKNEDDEYSALIQISADRARIIVDLTAQLKSAITMRPISELPDKVPDGCVIVQLNSEYVNTALTDEEHLGRSSDATHFYILPLPPAPERKLHPCHMPGCRGLAVAVTGENGTWRVKCIRCGMLGPIFNTKEKAELEWGHEE